MTESAPESSASEALPIHPALGCLFSVLAGLVAVALLFVTLSFALRGEVRFTTGPLTERRMWLVQDVGELGLGFSRSVIVRGSVASGQACTETRVRFLMLRTEETIQPVSYCECLERADGSWQATGGCEP